MCVTSIFTCGCEVWGGSNLHVIDKFQLSSMKRYLKLRDSTPNACVRSETRTEPFSNEVRYRMIKYWLRLLQELPDTRISRLMYLAQCELLHSGTNGIWASNVRDMLNNAGMGEVWLQQGVVNKTLFLRAFKTRLKDMFIAGWHHDVRTSSKCLLYRQAVIAFAQSNFLEYVLNTAGTASR